MNGGMYVLTFPLDHINLNVMEVAVLPGIRPYKLEQVVGFFFFFFAV
jgi:hypothetical protein